MNVETNGMNPEIKAQWLKDLRSGEFTQIQSRLTDGEGYCCLGVLCEQAVKAGVIDKKTTSSGDGFAYGTDATFRSEVALPEAVQDWANLDADPYVTFDHNFAGEGCEPDIQTLTEALSGANDDMEKTFSEIADLIEAQL